MKVKTITISTLFALLLLACQSKENKESITQGGMKCGPGKCGSSMVDGSAILVKKKMNILNQLNKKDNRRECVLNAKTTKTLYDCVRVSKTGKLSNKCNTSNTHKQDTEKKDIPKKLLPSSMKCEAGKCAGM